MLRPGSPAQALSIAADCRMNWHSWCLARAKRLAAGCRWRQNTTKSLRHQLNERQVNDQIQARVHLARRIYADAEFARQNADQGIRVGSDPRTAAVLGF